MTQPANDVNDTRQSDVFAAFISSGLWPGMSRTRATQLAEIGITRPEHVTAGSLTKLPRTTAKTADRLSSSFTNAAPAYAVVELLVPAGLPPRWAAALVEAYGPAAVDVVQADPWSVLLVPEAMPPQADALAVRVLAAPMSQLVQDPRRGRALCVHLLHRAARDGHTMEPLDLMRSALAALDVPDPDVALATADADALIVIVPAPAVEDSAEDAPLTMLAALPRYAMAEESVAEGLARLTALAEPICQPEGVKPVVTDLDPAQAAAVVALSQHGVSVLTGGPGTGKSRTVAAVVALAHVRNQRIALAAPTGRAAKRLEELTGEPAMTIHRLLGAQGMTGQFARGELWPLDADIVVVDEASMLDAELAAALIEAVPDGARLMLVGDPAQLPSIGAGRVLGDILDSAVFPVTELTTLHRQAEGGTIARLAIAVRGGVLPPVDDPTHEVVVVPARGSEDAAHRTVQLVTDSIPRALGIAGDDIQVVTPVHRGAAGTAALNTALKARLNPGTGTIGGFDVGDRVVATANHLDEGFANGEVGVVTAITEGQLVVSFAGSPPVSIPGGVLSDLRHGWAITVHRAQGSEWPAVVVVLPPEAGGMLSRPLVYTALTRAARHLSVVHAAGPALSRAVAQVGARPRRTRLSGLLREQG
ncbi:helix-hairpin-helix domain-containing protein [Acidothermaceae bacterium B102]|nr:helix-hairpin-helix domain-containing protein [Acidothermaceae bacterium B102]